jgi:aminoglycoside phosphotransferase family enzyme/predicted kinase
VLPPLVAALRRPSSYPHAVKRVRVIETHISWVLLAGGWAYKIKKPVALGFLDFSTLARRRRACREEVRLNRRLAPALYDAVVPIRGTPDAPRLTGMGPVLEYAVRMREFPQSALADRMAARSAIGPKMIDALARIVAEFHRAAPAVRKSTRFGTPAAVLTSALQNFEQIRPGLSGAEPKRVLNHLLRWTRSEHEARRRAFAARRRDGFVRECHGDLHLGNIAVIEGRPTPFDCIEFNPALRWIDVMSEVAFLTMDLADRGRADLASRFLNAYLEITGDYSGLEVLRFYQVYRALVRAKVDLLRARQPQVPPREKPRLARLVRGYLALAGSYTKPGRPALMITHGVSGSGKTTATQSLIELAGAVRIRSDVERKRLHGLAPLARSESAAGGGIYTPEANTATYAHLERLARRLLRWGFTVVVDAAFLKRSERDAFRALARELRAPFAILDFTAPDKVLAARVAVRAAGARDASEAGLPVLARQLATREPLAPEEMPVTCTFDTTRKVSVQAWRRVLARLLEGRGHSSRAARPARSSQSSSTSPRPGAPASANS